MSFHQASVRKTEPPKSLSSADGITVDGEQHHAKDFSVAVVSNGGGFGGCPASMLRLKVQMSSVRSLAVVSPAVCL